MPLVPSNSAAGMWRLVPAPIRGLLGSGGGKRLIRFAPAALLALAATQITFFICGIGVLDLGGFTSGALGWLAGATVSYAVSRWAWERKGRPDLLRETLPFVLISLGVGVVLTLTSKYASSEARELGLHGLEAAAFAQGFYLAANCVTFVTRFVIFHKFVFVDRAPVAAEALRAVPVTVPPGPADSDSLG